jgi:hypothetical protein
VKPSIHYVYIVYVNGIQTSEIHSQAILSKQLAQARPRRGGGCRGTVAASRRKGAKPGTDVCGRSRRAWYVPWRRPRWRTGAASSRSGPGRPDHGAGRWRAEPSTRGLVRRARRCSGGTLTHSRVPTPQEMPACPSRQPLLLCSCPHTLNVITTHVQCTVQHRCVALRSWQNRVARTFQAP